MTLVIYLVSSLATFLALTALFFKHFTTPSTAVWAQWTAVAIFFVFGNLVGFLLAKFRKVGIAALAAWGGVVAGSVITATVLVSNLGLYWTIVIGMAVVCALAAWCICHSVLSLAVERSFTFF